MTYEYDREQFRNFSTYIEVDYSAVDPRQLFREHKRDLQEIVVDDAYRYSLSPDSDTTVSLTQQPVGHQTGLVEGRLVADTEWEVFHSDQTVRESDSNTLAILLGMIGVSALLFAARIGGAGGGVLGILGLGTIAGAIAAYYRTTEHRSGSAYEYSRRIEILLQGEVCQQQHTEGDATAADLSADIGAVYAERTRVRNAGSSKTLDNTEVSAELENEIERNGSSVLRHLIDEESDPTLYVHRSDVEQLTAAQTQVPKATAEADTDTDEDGSNKE